MRRVAVSEAAAKGPCRRGAGAGTVAGVMVLGKARQATVQTALRRVRAAGRNVAARLPGRRPTWIVVELSGSYPARVRRRLFFGFPVPPELGWGEASLEQLQQDLDSLADAPWLEGVLFRVSDLRVDLATAFALRRAISGLRRAGKRTVAWLAQLDWTGYYVAAAAETVAAPESADVRIHGVGLSVTFLRDALARWGIRFEKIATGPYKSALDELVRQTMSEPQREQLEALLDSIEQQYVADVAADRGLDPAAVRQSIDRGLSTAETARGAGLIDHVAYEDELVSAEHKPLAESARFLSVRSRPFSEKRVAVIALTGIIVTGRSRRSPLLMPAMTSVMAGADSVVQCLRAAADDSQTAAAVLYVSSPGGSALASDLIWREVFRLRARMPVVAVAGALAASGGYYAMTAAHRIFVAPSTVTGSIGVLTGKLVLEDLYQRWGLSAERLQRGRYALVHDPAQPLSQDERDWLERANEEIYQRFVARVATGRRLDTTRVDELGQGRLWSGRDAVRHGLVDELGDVTTAVARAAELAGLSPLAASWNVRAPTDLLLPTPNDPTTLHRSLTPLLRERSLLLEPTLVAIA